MLIILREQLEENAGIRCSMGGGAQRSPEAGLRPECLLVAPRLYQTHYETQSCKQSKDASLIDGSTK